jgi:hypothetical protein
MAGPFDVTDQGDTPSLEMEKLSHADLTTRRREGACAIAFSPDAQLLPTSADNGHTISHSAAGNSENLDITILDIRIRRHSRSRPGDHSHAITIEVLCYRIDTKRGSGMSFGKHHCPHVSVTFTAAWIKLVCAERVGTTFH